MAKLEPVGDWFCIASVGLVDENFDGTQLLIGTSEKLALWQRRWLRRSAGRVNLGALKDRSSTIQNCAMKIAAEKEQFDQDLFGLYGYEWQIL